MEKLLAFYEKLQQIRTTLSGPIAGGLDRVADILHQTELAARDAAAYLKQLSPGAASMTGAEADTLAKIEDCEAEFVELSHGTPMAGSTPVGVGGGVFGPLLAKIIAELIAAFLRQRQTPQP